MSAAGLRRGEAAPATGDRPRRLADLRNVGKATLADFRLLGVESLEQLRACEPDALYVELQARTGQRQDPCVWDVFAAAIRQARTGEARDWWSFTPARKQSQAQGRFPA